MPFRIYDIIPNLRQITNYMKNSKLNRIYIQTEKDFPSIISISCMNRIHYIKNVLRLRLSDKIRIFNEIIGEYESKVILCDKKEIKIEILKENNHRKPLLCKKLTIAPAIIKNDRYSDLLDGSTQQGVTDIIPLITEYTNNRKISDERIERIVEEAVEQSERFDIPTISEPTKLKDIDFTLYDAVIFANEKEDESFKASEIFQKENILLITGPEGGFSNDEITFLASLPNSHSISLGPRILRAETAMNALIASVNFVRS